MKGWKETLRDMMLPRRQNPHVTEEDGEEELLCDLAIYRGEAPWMERCGGRSLYLGRTICRELARTVCAELEVGCMTRSGKPYAALNEQLERYLPRFHEAVGAVCGCGRVMLRLYPTASGIGVDLVLPDRYRVLRRGADGTPEQVCFYEYATADGASYLRREHHLLEDGRYTVEQALYLIDGGCARRVPLHSVPRFASLPTRTVIGGMKEGFFHEWRLDMGEGSRLGEAVWGRARGLMEDADRQYERLLWEFEGGELAVDVSEDAFRTDRSGHVLLPHGKDRLYRMNLLDGGEEGATMKVFSPALRDESLIRGLNRILMGLEDAVGLARGTLSDPSSVAKTATEVLSSRQRTHLSALQIRRQAKGVLVALADKMARLAWLYRMSEPCIFHTHVRFGDGILELQDGACAADREEDKGGPMDETSRTEKGETT